MKIICCFSTIMLLIIRFSFAGWEISVVDSYWDVGAHNSIDLDSNDNPHISYYVSDPYNDLRYASFNGISWEKSEVDYDGDVGEWTSLKLDSDDNPHISYCDNTNESLKYAYSDGAIWQLSTVDTQGWVGQYDSLDLDTNDRPHISYHNLSDDVLMYAYFDGSIWQISVVDSSGEMGWDTCIKVDSQHHPHISYLGYNTADLKYAYFNGTSWEITTIDSLGNVGRFNSLALDSLGNPHISYIDITNANLKYAYFDGLTWQVSVVESIGSGILALNTAIALDSENNPHIAYYYPPATGLKYAYYNGSAWQMHLIDSPHVGSSLSMVLDSSDNPHISYYDSANIDLKYAHYVSYPGAELTNFSAQTKPNGTIMLVWQISNTDETDIVGFNLYRATQEKKLKKDWTKLNYFPIRGANPYQFQDLSVKSGEVYKYKLSVLTADGKEEIIGTTQGTTRDIPFEFTLDSVYPNPAKSMLTCSFTIPHPTQVNLSLHDLSGRLVLVKNCIVHSGEQEIALGLDTLANGVYCLSASDNTTTVHKRIVIAK
jgi:hypothetical protein